MKLAVISDTHNKLRPEVLAQLQQADVILHGGDISRQSIVDQLQAIAPLYVVQGHGQIVGNVLGPFLVVVAPDHI